MKNYNFILTEKNIGVLRSHIMRLLNMENSLIRTGVYPTGINNERFLRNCGLSSRYSVVSNIQTQYYNNTRISMEIETLCLYDYIPHFIVRFDGCLKLDFPLNQKMKISQNKIEWKSEVNGRSLHMSLAVNKNKSAADRFIQLEKKMQKDYEDMYFADMELLNQQFMEDQFHDLYDEER